MQFRTRSLEPDDEHIQREIVPIVPEGLGYTGELRKAIFVALLSRTAFLNAPLLEAQLLHGDFLVVLDGSSEIRQEYVASAAEELPMFVSTLPSVHFLISSRSEVPVALLQSLRDPAVFRLQALDADTEEDFLARYLRDGPKAARVLVQEIHSRLPKLPQILLLLALIASTYDRLENCCLIEHRYLANTLAPSCELKLPENRNRPV